MEGNVQKAMDVKTRCLPSKNLKTTWETGSRDEHESTVAGSELVGKYSLFLHTN